MKKYSSNYCSKNNNYIIHSPYEPKKMKNESLYSSLCVIQNIIQRGDPTKPSTYLKSKLGNHNINESLKYISKEKPYWDISIKGNSDNNDNPALYFYKEVLTTELGEYSFITNLILPEAYINEITEEENQAFFNNQVDFYFPQIKLVIEIDGQQHNEDINKISDEERDIYLDQYEIKTLRIPVKEIRNYKEGNKGQLKTKIDEIYQMCSESETLKEYLQISENKNYYKENKQQIIYDTIMRFQVLIIELLKNQVLRLDDDTWIFNIKDDGLDIPYEIGVEDIENWLTDILSLQEIKFIEKKIVINKTSDFSSNREGINVDISLFKRWDDFSEDNVCQVRADYFDEKNYFKVATGELIKYKIKMDGKENNIQGLKNLNKNIFGFGEFNNGQLPIIINALSKIDTIGLLPTGGGKSLCYQLCCMLQPTINFVVVPIKSLMYDQKLNLDKKGIVHTKFINSEQEGKEKDKILRELSQGKYFYVWISPERFQNRDFREQLKLINTESTIGYAVIDEVHCLSEWGHDFRTSYLNLAKTIKKFCPRAIFLGLTATASKSVLKDILIEFKMNDENVKTILDYTREELSFQVIQDSDGNKQDKFNNLIKLLTEKNISEEVLKMDGENSKCGLVFTPHINAGYGCYGLVSKLHTMPLFKNKVKYYSGEVPSIRKQPILKEKEFNDYKKTVQYDFQNNKFPILFATKAFGMGIDKGNVRYTIHYGMPGSIESFYQEAGRAGRDKKKAICYILNSKDTIDEAEYEKLFALKTTIEEIKDIVDANPYPPGDILRNLFLSIQSEKGLKEECTLAYEIYLNFCMKGKDIITVSDVRNLGLSREGKKIECNFASIQKAIYRLSLLGIIEDWTIEGWNQRGKFKVVLAKISEEAIAEHLNNYIKKYDNEFDVNKLNEVDKYKEYIKFLSYKNAPKVRVYLAILIQWTYDNIFYNRRVSQKNLVDLCDRYFKEGEAVFKKEVEVYFKITENSFMLDNLVSNPYDYKAMYQTLFNDNSVLKNEAELKEVNITLTRFLESYRYNTSLNYLSGILSLMFDEFHDKSKLERLKSAFESISTRNDEEKKQVLDRTLEIGKTLSITAKDELSDVLCAYYDKEIIYKSLADNVSLNLILKDVIDRIDKVEVGING